MDTQIRNTSLQSALPEKHRVLALSPQRNRVNRQIEQVWKLSALPLLLFIALPLFALFQQASFTEVVKNLRNPQVVQAISLSLVSSFASTLVTVLFGTPVAYLLAQPNLRFRRLYDTLIDLPIVLPPSVAGLALLMAFGRRGLVGEWLTPLGVAIPFTTLAVVLAQVFIACPYYIKGATVGFSSIDDELKQAAALDGADRWQTFRFVTVPLSWMASFSGGVMTWARAMGEFGATIIFAGNFPGRTQTMPLAIYIGFEIDMSIALTLSIIMISFSFITLLLVKIITNRQMEVEARPVVVKSP